MFLNDLPYFVKFTFTGEGENECYSIADSETLKFVKHRGTDESITCLRIGDTIYFEGETGDKTFKVSDIFFKGIQDDLELQKYGIDSEDCAGIAGNPKQWLFKIFVRMQLVNNGN